MGEGYILEGLDTLIFVTLNHEKSDLTLLQAPEIESFQNFIDDEKYRVMLAIKRLVFKIDEIAKIKSALNLYHSSLIVMLEQTLKNQTQISKYSQLNPTINKLVGCINEILFLIESRFSNFLDSNQRLPKTYFDSVKNELLPRILAIEQQLKIYTVFKPTLEIMIQVLINFLNQTSTKYSITFQEIEYIKELCSEAENIKYRDRDLIFSRLDELLIYMNFNSRIYLDNLTQKLSAAIDSYEKKEEKMEWLLFHFKIFKLLPKKVNVIFNRKQPDLDKSISDWFHQEIVYTEKNRRLFSEEKDSTSRKISSQKHKVTCVLSTDQTGLIIRAADELRILMAKSMSEVFRTIVPHLSTPYKKDLSYDGMRSKSYVAEERDKKIAIQTLQRLIKKIEEY